MEEYLYSECLPPAALMLNRILTGACITYITLQLQNLEIFFVDNFFLKVCRTRLDKNLLNSLRMPCVLVAGWINWPSKLHFIVTAVNWQFCDSPTTAIQPRVILPVCRLEQKIWTAWLMCWSRYAISCNKNCKCRDWFLLNSKMVFWVLCSGFQHNLFPLPPP